MATPGSMIKRRIYLWRHQYRLLLRLYYDVYLHYRIPIIIYQMGKVGSISIASSLRACGLKNVYHTHVMDLNNILLYSAREADEKRIFYEKEITRWGIGDILCQDIIKQQKHVKIITLVREPIARNISHFYAALKRFVHMDYSVACQDHNHAQIFDAFLKKYKHSTVLDWFDIEMNTMLGIDVYAYPFPKETGYMTIKKRNIELLIIKSEIANSIKEQAISKFLRLDNFHITNQNVTSDKDYAQAYRDFVQNVQLPASYIETMYHSKLVRHFYSPEEIEQFRAKWLRNS